MRRDDCFAEQSGSVRPFPLITCLAISACAPVAGGGGYLPLAPLDGLLAQADVSAVDPGPALAARAARLRARMVALQP